MKKALLILIAFLLAGATSAFAQEKHQMAVYVTGAGGAASGVIKTVLGVPITTAFKATRQFDNDNEKAFSDEATKLGRTASVASVAEVARKHNVRFICLIDASGVRVALGAPPRLSGSVAISIVDAITGNTVGAPQNLAMPPSDVAGVARQLVTLAVSATAGAALAGTPAAQPTPQDNRQMQDRMQQQIQGTPAQAPVAPPPPPRPAPPPLELRPLLVVQVAGHHDAMVNNIMQTDIRNALVRAEYYQDAPRHEEFQTAVANERARNQQLTESRIVEIAKQHGAQRICITSIMPILESYYFTVKIIDTRNGDILGSTEFDGSLATLTDVRTTSAKLAEAAIELAITIPPPRFCRVVFFNERQQIGEAQVICGDPLGGDALPQRVASSQFGTRFEGWQGIDDRQEYNAQSVINRNTRITAVWKKELCRISFFNGEQEIKSDTLRCGQAIGNRIPRNVPPLARHNFTGWFDANGAEQTAQTVITDDVRISTRWQKVLCVVSFFNESEELKSDTLRCGSALDTLLPSEEPAPPRENIRFVGWVDADRNEYHAQTVITDDVRIGARWVKNRCRVVFLDDTREFFADSVTCGDVLGKAFPSEIPRRENDRFEKWIDAGRTEVTPNTRVTEDVQFAAQFVRLCRVNIVHGFEPVRTEILDCGKALGNLMPPPQTHDDYHFRGWFDHENANYRSAVTVQVTNATIINDNISIYARWTEKFKPETRYGVRLAGNVSSAEIFVYYSEGAEISMLRNKSSGVGVEAGGILDVNFARYNHFITELNLLSRAPVNITGEREFVVREVAVTIPALYRLNVKGVFGELGLQFDIPFSNLDDRKAFDVGFAMGGGFFINRNIGFDIRRIWGGKYLDGQSANISQTNFGAIYMF